MSHVLAVDWSGASKELKKKLWSAEVRDGALVALEPWDSRDALVDFLLERGRSSPELLVGLDFAFAFPAWFTLAEQHPSIEDTWRWVAERGEGWLASCPPPFFGRPKSTRPQADAARPLLRRTEFDLIDRGLGSPKSVFQIGGPGAVGTGSLRGMPHLERFVAEGRRVWPFLDAEGPTVFETWPRLYTRGLVKSAPGARARWVEAVLSDAQPAHRVAARGSDDALDAAATALGIHRALASGAKLEDTELDEIDRREGRIATLLSPEDSDPNPRRTGNRRLGSPRLVQPLDPPVDWDACDTGF